MRRRAFLGGALALSATALGGAALASRPGADVLRIGVMTNLAHAPLLAGLGSGRIARAIAPIAVDVRVFRAGPRVTEALLGRAIDVGIAGPAAIVIHHARHAADGGGLRVLSGCASGGASLVVARGSGIAEPGDVRGKRLAVTQIGTTQDVALRRWLRRSGLGDTTNGGDVAVIAVAPAVILDQMRRGELHGAWLAEPWATRLEREIGATRLIDERDLWPGRAFATAALAARADRAADPRVVAVAAALRDEIARARLSPDRTLEEAYGELSRHVGNPGARAIFDAAARYVEFTADPLRSSFARFADDAADLGLMPRSDVHARLFG
jgi:NitT/TauT family transport system substrate-binding protein